MDTFIIISLLFLAISQLAFILFFIRFRSNLKTLFKKLSTYDQLQDIDIDVIRKNISEINDRLVFLSSLFHD